MRAQLRRKQSRKGLRTTRGTYIWSKSLILSDNEQVASPNREGDAEAQKKEEPVGRMEPSVPAPAALTLASQRGKTCHLFA